MPRQIEIPCDELRVQYQTGETTTSLAQLYSCSPATIAERLRECGVALRSSRFQAAPVPEAMLRYLYLERHLPIAAIAAYFGVSTSTIGNKRRQYGIPKRGRR